MKIIFKSFNNNKSWNTNVGTRIFGPPNPRQLDSSDNLLLHQKMRGRNGKFRPPDRRLLLHLLSLWIIHHGQKVQRVQITEWAHEIWDPDQIFDYHRLSDHFEHPVLLLLWVWKVMHPCRDCDLDSLLRLPVHCRVEKEEERLFKRAFNGITQKWDKFGEKLSTEFISRDWMNQ